MRALDRSLPVGFVGLGNLGEGMARSLVRDGWRVSVLDRDPGRADRCVAEGATVVSTPDELAGCAIVALAVPDDAAVSQLVEGVAGGTGGLLDTLARGALVIVHSTVLPATARRLAEQAEQAGLSVLDAPVSGGPDRALAGDLTIMVGGDDDAVAAARPLLEVLGSTVTHMGPSGAGAATKLANQLMMFSTLAGVHEAIELAAAHGVAAETLLEAVSTGTAGSWVGSNWGFFDRVAADYDGSGTPLRDRPWSKDLHEVVEAARTAGVAVPVAALLAQTLAATVEGHAAAHRPV